MKKILLIIILVVGGLAVAANQAGTSIKNLLAGMLPFLRPEVTINLANEELADLGEQEIIEDFAYINLQCGPEPSGLGDRVCGQNIKSLNGIPANTIAFFFKNNKLINIAAIFPSSAQPQIAKYLNKEFVFFRNKREGTVNPEGMATWVTTSGIIAAHPGSEPPQRDARMIWRSYESLKRGGNTLAIELMKIKAREIRINM